MALKARTGPGRAVTFVGWAVAAVLAGWIAWWAVALIAGRPGTGSTGVLTQAQVEALAAEQTTAPPGPPSPEPTPPGATSTSPSTSTAGPEVVRTWTVPGGGVGAACRDTTITLLFATPDDGWTVEVKDAGPENLEIEFRHGEDETTTLAACQGGIPTLLDESTDD